MIRLELIEYYAVHLLEANKAFSFINFSSVGSFFDHGQNNVAYFCDGILMSTFMSGITGQPIRRISFDFTSIAHTVFTDAEKQGKSLYFVGAKQAELELFLGKLKDRYPGLIVAGHHDGFFDAPQAERLKQTICRSTANILIVGLGAGLQEQFMHDVLQRGFTGVAFSCGGFIRQESKGRNDYYPERVNRLHLRAFYRMYREPHTILRYLIDYPVNFTHLLTMIIRKELAINTVAPTERRATPMHILFILKDVKQGGGVERVQQCLAGQFLKDGQRVSFFVMNDDTFDGKGAPILNGGGTGVVGLLKSIVKLRRIIRDEGVTHLIAAKEQANLCTWFATLGSQCKVIYTRHAALDSTEQRTGPASLLLLYALYLCGSGNVVTVSNSLRQNLAAILPWGRKRISVCPNAVITDQLFTAARAPLPAGLPAEYWLGVGRLIALKGFDLLLDAYAKVASSDAPPDLVIAGDGPELSALTAQARRLGIEDRVHFTGFLSNPYPLIRHAQLFVLSSREEGLPTVLIEALALGTPVLATDCDTGPRELLDSSCLVKANDVPALAEGLQRSLALKGRAMQGERVPPDTVRQYTSQHAAQAYYQVWER
ncbi:MAG: putative glycosyltransferase [Pseudomonas sp.]|nr:putative glycosyltransferase [Pseudomonas sp.]